MTHKSLFKETAQRFVQRGQMSDIAEPSVQPDSAAQPEAYSGTSGPQMNAHGFGPKPGSQLNAPRPLNP
jgi:hypothetical protein